MVLFSGNAFEMIQVLLNARLLIINFIVLYASILFMSIATR